MAETYFPFDSGAGSAITEAEWREMAKLWLSDGVIRGDSDGLAVSERSSSVNASVDVAAGTAWVDGHYYNSDAVENLTIAANASGNDRIDLVVVRADFTANTITTAVVEGTAAATPVPPGVTQSSSTWEIPLAQVAVANGFVSITDSDITDVRQYAAGKQDWQHIPGTLAFSSDADDPTFVMTSTADLTGLVPLGARFRCAQASGDVYGIVTAVSSTTLTIYGGTDYTLADEAITSPEFSIAKVPVGFVANPATWTEELLDTSARSQSTPTSGTFYNPGSLSLTIPIGVWRIGFSAGLEVAHASATSLSASGALSTANNSASDSDLVVNTQIDTGSGVLSDFFEGIRSEKVVALAAKTTYYLTLAAFGSSVASVEWTGSSPRTRIYAVCAYL